MSDPKTASVTVGGVTYTIRKPKYAEWRKFKAGIASTNANGDGTATIDAIEDLAKACCTSHSGEQLDQAVEDELGLFEELAGAATKLAGVVEAVRASKSR